MLKQHRKYAKQLLTLITLLGAFSMAEAAKLASIIIDDIGNSYEHGQAIINLPVAVTLAILPQTEFATTLATQAHRKNKEIMLHLPCLLPLSEHPLKGLMLLFPCLHLFL